MLLTSWPYIVSRLYPFITFTSEAFFLKLGILQQKAVHISVQKDKSAKNILMPHLNERFA